jgi:1,4-alpha-glucan branching enzyme
MVMGEFNNWLPEQMDMRFRNSELQYFYATVVPVGYKYRYQFIINGQITTDSRQPQSESTLIGKITNYKVVTADEASSL